MEHQTGIQVAVFLGLVTINWIGAIPAHAQQSLTNEQRIVLEKAQKKQKRLLTAAEPAGWCCVNGKVLSTTRARCKINRGVFATRKAKAVAACPKPLARPRREIKPQKPGRSPVVEPVGRGFPISDGDTDLNLFLLSQPHWGNSPVAGDIGALDYAFECRGGGCGSLSTVWVGLEVDGRLTLAQEHTRSLAEGGFRYLRNSSGRINWSDPDCGATVRLVIDPYNTLTETDEADNEWFGTVNCVTPPDTDKPDLSIYTAWPEPWPVAEGEAVTFHYQVLNSGRFGEVTTGPFNVGLRVGDSIIRSNRHTGVPHHASVTGLPEGTLAWTAHCGEPFAVVVDTAGEVDEGDETNNAYDGSGTVVPFECFPARVDLRMSLFDTASTGTTIPAGVHVEFVADVLADHGDPRDVRITCGVEGGAVFYDHTYASLPPAEAIGGGVLGERAWFSAALCPAGATLTLYCEADPANAVIERDETNNRRTLDVTTVASPAGSCP